MGEKETLVSNTKSNLSTLRIPGIRREQINVVEI